MSQVLSNCRGWEGGEGKKDWKGNSLISWKTGETKWRKGMRVLVGKEDDLSNKYRNKKRCEWEGLLIPAHDLKLDVKCKRTDCKMKC